MPDVPAASATLRSPGSGVGVDAVRLPSAPGTSRLRPRHAAVAGKPDVSNTKPRTRRHSPARSFHHAQDPRTTHLRQRDETAVGGRRARARLRTSGRRREVRRQPGARLPRDEPDGARAHAGRGRLHPLGVERDHPLSLREVRTGFALAGRPAGPGRRRHLDGLAADGLRPRDDPGVLGDSCAPRRRSATTTRSTPPSSAATRSGACSTAISRTAPSWRATSSPWATSPSARKAHRWFNLGGEAPADAEPGSHGTGVSPSAPRSGKNVMIPIA